MPKNLQRPVAKIEQPIGPALVDRLSWDGNFERRRAVAQPCTDDPRQITNGDILLRHWKAESESVQLRTCADMLRFAIAFALMKARKVVRGLR
jgi:hypothetical protein